jgi:hypothetical protein
MARGSVRRRVDTLENERRVRENEDNEELIRNYDEFWEMEVEHTALHLLRGVEPYFTLDERDAFLTLDGRFALSRRRMDLRALMGPLTQQIQQSMPSERWGQFLAADEQAAELLRQLLGRAQDAEVPDAYREPGHSWHNQGEINDQLGNHDLGSIFADAEEREATRRLTWTLIHDPEARAMLSKLTRLRDAFSGSVRLRA